MRAAVAPSHAEIRRHHICRTSSRPPMEPTWAADQALVPYHTSVKPLDRPGQGCSWKTAAGAPFHEMEVAAGDVPLEEQRGLADLQLAVVAHIRVVEGWSKFR